VRAQQSLYLAQEQDASLPRSAIDDGRVDACIYALPTNARVSPFDLAIMQQLADVVPVIAVMSKSDCMTQVRAGSTRAYPQPPTPNLQPFNSQPLSP